MTAEQWLQAKFVCNEESGSFDWGTPMKQGVSSVFLSIFGSTIQAALDAGRNPVDDLVALEDKRGWGPDFATWKTQGI